MATEPQKSRAAYLVIAGMLTMTAILGFWSGYFGPMLAGGVRHFWFIHVHAAVFLLWMLLLLLQAALVTCGKVSAHRTIGIGGALWGIVVIVVGFFISVAAPVARAQAGQLQPDVAELVALFNLTDMVVFTAFFAAAMRYRADKSAHKRLIVCSSIALTGAAVGRVLPSDSIVYLVAWLFPLLVAFLLDWSIERRVHPVFVIAVPVFVFMFVKVSIYSTAEFWHSLGEVFVGPFL